LEKAITECEAPEAECIDEDTIAAEVALEELADSVSEAEKDLKTAEENIKEATQNAEIADSEKEKADKALVEATANKAQLEKEKSEAKEDFRTKAMDALLCDPCTAEESAAAVKLAEEARLALTGKIAALEEAEKTFQEGSTRATEAATSVEKTSLTLENAKAAREAAAESALAPLKDKHVE